MIHKVRIYVKVTTDVKLSGILNLTCLTLSSFKIIIYHAATIEVLTKVLSIVNKEKKAKNVMTNKKTKLQLIP